MNALLIGANGATGNDLLQLLLKDESIGKVVIFVRKEVVQTHEKLIQHIIDFDQPQQWQALVKGDVLFSCLGTTLKMAGSKSAQWKIDYEYQFQFAQFAKENGVEKLVLVSAVNASPKSSLFYPKMKGQLEHAVKALQFPTLIIFKPTLLIRKNTDRKMEIFAARLIRFFNSLGMLRSQEPIATEKLAEAMLKAAKLLTNGSYTFEGQEVLKFHADKV